MENTACNNGNRQCLIFQKLYKFHFIFIIIPLQNSEESVNSEKGKRIAILNFESAKYQKEMINIQEIINYNEESLNIIKKRT